ncbi:ATP-dependent helicase [Corynebacterium xerosis]|uniref:ATP-dependent helicase n=1 Tax=Corynebacterium xerosis TaxID=1725 RepID=A0A6B8TZX4_9CORY|nr:ATP-dependent helicase [Corynebacterium xerosis]
MASSRDTDPLGRFTPSVATWFRDVFAEPTDVQVEAWKAISEGENALVVAPTGSGKTLAAFLWAIGSLVEGRHEGGDGPRDHVRGDSGGDSGTDPRDRGQAARGVRVLYISPLKALAVDVENNLRAPLTGINRVAARLGQDPAKVSVAVRSGDTPSSERARQVRNPPDILITTPESLYLLLTSKAREILGTVDTVIIDEIHAMAGTKRGVHLALSLERLERLAGREIQRIGLSATVRPLTSVARLLGGDRPVEIIDPPSRKEWELGVHVAVEDMSDLQDRPVPSRDSIFDDGLTAGSGTESALPTQGSIWPFIEERVFDEIMGHRSTLVFVNSRRTAERLTSRLNELHALRTDPGSLSPELRRPPAQIMKATDVAGTAPAVIARAHHGSVSKDERATIESMLKEGSLRAVVSTSSLELGIDMGAVEKVIQVESPPSVASGLQRVGRAGHVVGAVSRGSFYPKHRADLLQTAVVVDRMSKGLIEELHVPVNALDVLAQHTVAAVAMDGLDVDDWFGTVTAAHPYRGLSRQLFDAVIDLVSGTYPSTDFAELRPRVVYDRITGVLSARPGAQRTAVINGGTIPDRGMFGVFLAGGGDAVPRRVGELDEEMVYESRVGDVFTLGASSWRIEQIDRDRVLVTPAPGHTGRLPFWNGDQAGRPAELGKALGAFRRLAAADGAVLEDIGLDPWARDNLTAYLEEQAQATGVIPDERTLVLERFRDELGDWRVVLHSPYGLGVNAAWALAAGAKFSRATGMDAQPVASDDGIVLRVPDSAAEPSSDLFLIDPDDVEAIVAEQVGNSALFASRFRECAARALLLPSRNPGKRAPLWQQRQRSAQLLDVAKQYPKFPIVLEAVRECMQDVYDLPALVELCGNLRERTVRIAEVTTQTASPFATSILFTYTGAFMYEGDGPLAEKRAAALALDPALLTQLLGGVELRDLLDPAIIAEVNADLRRRSERRRASTAEQLMDTLRVIGPVPLDEVGRVSSVTVDDAERELGHRLMRVRIAGVEHIAQSLDAALLRDGLGVPVPPGVPARADVIPDALEQLVARWARTRGPFTHGDVRDAFGVAASVAHAIVGTLAASKTVVEGRYRQGVDEPEFLAPEVLKTIRSRSLAAARAQTEPVSGSTFGRFLPRWQQVAPVLPAGREPEARGADGVFAVIEQLAGVRLPASAWETLVLPQRVRGYRPSDLDELTANGEVLVVGAGSAGAADPWVKLLPADYAAQLVDVPDVPDVANVADSTDAAGLPSLGELQQRILGVLADGGGGGFLFGHISRLVGAEGTGTHADGVGGNAAGGIPAAGAPTATDIREALWSLFELGLVSPDGFAPLRARLSGGSGGRTAHRARRTPARGRLRMGRTSFAQANRAMAPADMMGRWSTTIDADTSATARSVALGEAWLDRYGVVTRGSVVAEATVGGFALAYGVLSRFEEAGKAMRGMVIDGLGAAQFSTPAVIDRLRGLADTPDVEGWPSGTDSPEVHVLAAVDPANPYGAALPWPERGPTRSAGSLVVVVDGLLGAHLTRGGRTLTLFDPPPGLGHEDVVALVVGALDRAIGRNMIGRIVIEKVGDDAVIGSEWANLLRSAGARITPKGVRIGGTGAGSAGSGSAGARA